VPWRTGTVTAIGWTNPAYASDGDIETYAYRSQAPQAWTPYLTVVFAASFSSDKLRICKYDGLFAPGTGPWELAVGTAGALEIIWNAAILEMYPYFREISFSERTIDRIRLRFFNPDYLNYNVVRVHEYQAWEIPAPPPAAPYGYGNGLVTIQTY